MVFDNNIVALNQASACSEYNCSCRTETAKTQETPPSKYGIIHAIGFSQMRGVGLYLAGFYPEASW
jgi:hypothetical protein